MIVSLSLLVLVAISARTVSGDSCYGSYLKIDDLPDYFFRTTKGHKLKFEIDSYKAVKTYGVYNYYGKKYKQLNVDVHGNIAFGTKLAARYPYRDIAYDIDMVAVFWAATDITTCGNVFYRETNKQKPRNRFRQLVNDVFGYEFNPTYVFIVTYLNVDQFYEPCCVPLDDSKRSVDQEQEAEMEEDDVVERDARAFRFGDASFASRSSDRPVAHVRDLQSDAKSASSHRLNSYQIVLATDGSMTFALLNYVDKIEWTEAPYSMAGFWTEYEDKAYMYKKSFMSTIKTLPDHGTNTGVTSLPDGQYLFRVDEFPTPFINDPASQPQKKFKNWP